MTYPFEQAVSYSKGRGGKKPLQIFLHTMETPETPGRAKQVWQWFGGKTSPKASAHFMTDATVILQSVQTSDTAWAVDDFALNQSSISIEMSGIASQTAADWADAYSTAELALVAKLVAELCKQFSIPVVKLSPADVAANKAGIAGHWDVTLGKKIAGGHTDPGKNFPWDKFIAQVKALS